MGKITFNIGQGGLGRPLAGKDYYSGFLFDSAVYPSGFSASEPIKLLASLQDAENLGIVDDGTGETVATGGTVEITAVGAAGDIWTVQIKSTRNPAIELAVVVEGAAETPTTLAARIADAINAGTSTHGFTASAALAVVTLVMAANWGAAFNTAGLTAASSAAGTATVTQFDSGVGSDLTLMHYHISEFFRIQPQGLLWFGIYDESGGLNGDHIADIVNFSLGEIRQIGVFLKTTWASADLSIIQATIEALQVEYKRLNAIYAADQLGDVLSTLIDCRALTNDRVSACIGQDGGAEGWRLVDVMALSVSCIGAALGTIALAAVHENIGWVSQFNVSGGELDVLSFTTGDLYGVVSTPTLELLNNRGYVFTRKYIGKSGSFYNDSPTTITETSDYAYIENGRTIDKAVRGVNVALTDYLNSPLYVDPVTGRLTDLTISNFKNSASIPLENMLVDGELSGYQVIIDDEQNVLATSKVELTIKLVPVGVAREIVVNIGYTVSLT